MIFIESNYAICSIENLQWIIAILKGVSMGLHLLKLTKIVEVNEA
jgi:hypothetical protein